jgi:hypothetical protein
MFNFGTSNKASVQDIMATAEATKTSPIKVAINSNGYGDSRSFWGQIKDNDNEVKSNYANISICNSFDVVGKYVSALSESVQFPRSSAYAHFVGCISAAMLGRFSVEYYGKKQPTGLYFVIAQPPSSGKSAINESAIEPMIAEVERLNDLRKKERTALNAKLAQLKAELKAEQSPSSLQKLYEDKAELEDKIARMNPIVFPVSDTTPEGLARINANQGSFAVISDEATAINSLLGMTYGDASRKTNSELVLKAWDSGHVSITRANAENNMSFVAMGAISVIAQDETINSIMSAGERGIGVSERFGLVREAPLLGTRVFCDANGESTFKPVPIELKTQYFKLIHNIMSESNIELRVSHRAATLLNLAKQEMEEKLKDGGEYGHTMLRGAMGKFDKQTTRIAAVLHVIRNWCDGGLRDKEISYDTMCEAKMIFDELSRTYLASAESSGFAGDKTEMKSVKERVIAMGKAGKGRVSRRALIEACQKVKPFINQQGTPDKVDKALEKLEKENFVCVCSDSVYINPTLLG